MKNSHVRLISALGLLTVYLRVGKSGINVGFSQKGPKLEDGPAPKAVNGPTKNFKLADGVKVEDVTTHDESQAYFNSLVADAEAKGWTKKTRPAAKPRNKRSILAEIPAVPKTEEAPAT